MFQSDGFIIFPPRNCRIVSVEPQRDSSLDETIQVQKHFLKTQS